MKSLISFLGALLLIIVGVGQTSAQARPKFEIGTQAGLSIMSAGGETITTIAAPGGGFGGSPTIYAVLYGSSNVAFEPRLGFNRVSSDGSSFSTLDAAGRIKVFFDDPSESSGYTYGEGAVIRVGGSSSSDSNFGAGAGVGFRHVAASRVAVSIEGGYRRWFIEDEGLNEFTVSIGVGAIVGAS